MSTDNNDALAALEAALQSTPEIKTSENKKPLTNKAKPYALFSSSILVCYLQGEASPLYMQEPAIAYDAYSHSDNEKIKNFLKPLFLILHNNKNLKFRPINTHLLSDAGLLRFERILNSFRKETRLEAFLENYREFLLFLSSESLTIKEEKVFTNLSTLLERLKEYRLHCIVQGAAKESETILSEEDIANISF